MRYSKGVLQDGYVGGPPLTSIEQYWDFIGARDNSCQFGSLPSNGAKNAALSSIKDSFCPGPFVRQNTFAGVDYLHRVWNQVWKLLLGMMLFKTPMFDLIFIFSSFLPPSSPTRHHPLSVVIFFSPTFRLPPAKNTPALHANRKKRHWKFKGGGVSKSQNCSSRSCIQR